MNYEGLVDKVKIVVNRSGLDKTQIGLKKAEETIGREVFWQIPNNYSVVSEGRNNGVPLVNLAPKANVTLTIAELAEKICSDADPAEPKPEAEKSKKGLFSFLSK